MKKTAIISYRKLGNIPIGLHQIGNVDIFTADFGFEKSNTLNEQVLARKKNELLADLHKELLPYIDDYLKIMIYIGQFPEEDVPDEPCYIFEMLNEYFYNRPNKKVIIVGCGCSKELKQKIVTDSDQHIVWQKVSCEPEKELLAIIEDENNLVTAE